jgi:3-hydroxyisobutyrate dehydrogenase-like beta-hydroxyacid dehydrogenase
VTMRWLIVGHGTVGSVLAMRILSAGDVAWVHDAAPRLQIPAVPGLLPVDADTKLDPDVVVICVPAAGADAVGEYLRRTVDGTPMIFDWTSSLPASKSAVADQGTGSWIDIALLDSLDRSVGRPLLAISGANATDAAKSLERIGFDVLIAGEEVGQAATVKMTRSLFMKSLEALIIESRSIASGLDPSGAAWLSVERSLGCEFSEFADMLVTSNAVHAARRSGEIRQANTLASEHGYSPVVAVAAERVLAELSSVWAASSPESETSVNELVLLAQSAFKSPPAA